MNAANLLGGLLKGLAYLAFFVLCTLLFTYLTFPTEKVRDFAEAKASDQLGSKVRIGELNLDGERLSIHVTDLSRDGIRFELSEAVELRQGEELVVEFELVHAETTLFVKPFEVKWVDGRMVGGEFVAASDLSCIDDATLQKISAAPENRRINLHVGPFCFCKTVHHVGCHVGV